MKGIAITFRNLLCMLVALLGLLPASVQAEWIWVEGETPTQSSMNRHPWWYDQVKRDQFSGGNFISNFHLDKSGEAAYSVQAGQGGEHEFWVRANPLLASLSYRLNDGPWTAIDLTRDPVGNTNVAADGKPDLRFIAWVKVGRVELKKGANAVAFRMEGKQSNHGYLDCFVFSTEPFEPRGLLKPDQIAAADKRQVELEGAWFAFDPKPDRFEAGAGFDLRDLNEKVAGEGGFIAARDGQFVHSTTGKPVRFWAVNGPPSGLKDRQSLRRCARLLAKYGVNLVRIHGGLFDGEGNVDPAKVKHAIDIVESMKEEGIYSHLSIYFPLWMRPKPGNAFLKGYDGTKHPFAALYFNEDFQKQYRKWWEAVLLTKSEASGKALIDEPALAGVEIINEDSYFFWTFDSKNIPDEQLRILEKQFGDWLARKYGSIDNALGQWKGPKVARDNPAEGRVGFRPLWSMFNEKTPRDKDTAAFLLASQKGFYEQTYGFLRGIGFKGLITASNWATASPQVFGPLEKYSYTAGDFIDRHGYFGCNHKGENAAWSVRNEHTYVDRSALRFDPEQPGKPKLFVHPAMDIHYANKPSMISETTFNRPNRYRSEAPLYFAAYGALQGSDAIVHFALDGSRWGVKPNFWMQPWTLMSPAMMGQFPAAALIYRQGLVTTGPVLVELNLKVQDLLDLKGTPLPQDAAFDELRLKDVPQGTEIRPGNVIDPLVHYAGRTSVNFTEPGGSPKLADLRPYIDRPRQIVTSATKELTLDYGRGLLRINAPAAQGVSGTLNAAGTVETENLVVSSDMELGHIVAVSLDGKPLGQSQRILLQVMSEEKPSGFRTEEADGQSKKILNIGQDPWMVRELKGTVRLKAQNPEKMRVQALDLSGYPVKDVGGAEEIRLMPTVVYYLISR